MSYASLMVHVDVGHACERRIRLAMDLADQFHATLIGTSGWAVRPAVVAPGIVVDLATTARELADMTARLDEVKRAFHAQTGKIKSVEWRGGLDFPIDIVLREARAADLIIVGRERASGDLYSSLDAGSVVLQAGRPVLLVPDSIDALPARRIVVAWKDTREARRAVRDALPFLQKAAGVLVVEVCNEGAESEARGHLDDLTNYLGRHRVEVAAKACVHAKKSIESELMRFADEEKADLIVAGGYGHTRLGEWIFGGVTNDLLTRSPICCLLSH